MLGLFPYFILSQILFDFPAVRDFSSKKYNDTRIYVTNIIYEAETTRITFIILHAQCSFLHIRKFLGHFSVFARMQPSAI
jgi:hypothetical protein